MYVYVLKNLIDGTNYTGLTENIEKRFKEHNDGRNYSTKSKRPWKLIHVEIAIDRKEARNLEKFFKSGYGRETINEIEQN